MRLNKINAALRACDAGTAILKALADETMLLDKFRDVVAIMLGQLQGEADEIAKLKTVSRRAQACSTFSFVVKNLADSMKALGLVGTPKGLSDQLRGGSDGAPGWKDAVAQQVNVQINVAGGKAEALTKVAETTVEAKSGA